MKIIVFAGPSINQADAQSILDCIYLPPLEQADFTTALYQYKPDVVAIIDGISCPEKPVSVWHNEILHALDNGVMVFGAGAIGALRAAELNTFGMIGSGTIFNMIKEGLITSDPDVLCRYKKNGNQFIRISEPKVNIEASLKAALSENILSNTEYLQFQQILKEIHWSQLTRDEIFQKAHHQDISIQTIEKLKLFFDSNYRDPVKDDATELIEHLSHLTENEVNQFKRAHPHQQQIPLSLFKIVHERERKVSHSGQNLRLAEISNYVSLNHPEGEELQSNMLHRCLTLYLAQIYKVEATPDELEEEKHWFRKKYQLEEPETFNTWLRENDWSMEEFEETMRESAITRKMRRWFLGKNLFFKNTKNLLDELRLRNEYSTWAQKSAQFEAAVSQQKEEFQKIAANTGTDELINERMQKKGLPWNTNLFYGMFDFGFDIRSFHLLLAKEKAIDNYLNNLVKDFFGPATNDNTKA